MLERWNLRAQRMENRWRGRSARSRAWIAGLLLTAAVVALFAGCFAALLLTGNGLIFRDDDYQQHYPFLMAIGRWLRTLLTDPSRAARFDFSLGFGADRLAGLNYYGLGDPLLLWSALFDGPATYVCYVLLVLLRHVLAALSFLALCRAFGVRYRHALAAAAAYAFTNYMIAWCALKHPMFANPVVHLPLMLLGAEKRLRGESPWVLALSTAWSALCGFYFLYMNSLMLLLYALARHFCMRGRDGWRTLPGAFWRCVGPYLLGLCLAAATLLPAALGYLTSTRSGLGGGGNLLLWDADVYWAWPISFIASNGWNNAMTVPVAAMLAACALFRQRRSNRALAAAVAATMVALLVPAVGWAFNGFAYPSDRWKYGGLLLLCFVMARFAPEVERGRAGVGYLLATLLWSAALLARRVRTGAEVPHVLLIALAAALSLGGGLYLLLARRLQRRLSAFPALERWTGDGLLAAFVAVNLLLNGLTICMDPILTEPVEGSAWTRRRATSLWALEDVERPDGFYRTDLTADEYFQYNAPAVTGAASTSVYDSIRPAQTARFMEGLALNTDVSANRTHGLDGRAALEAIWSVKYLTAPSDARAAAPYGFEKVRDDGTYAVWENRLALPAAYVMDGYMLMEDYEALGPLERQWALVQCAVLKAPDDRYERVVPAQTLREVPWRRAATDNAEWSDGALTFGPGGGSVELEFDGLPDSETYLALEGAIFDGDDGQLYLSLESHGDAGRLILPADGYEYSLHRRDFLNNLGHSREARRSVTIRCDHAARVDVASIRIFCQPMEDLARMLDALRDDSMQVEAGADRFTARTNFDSDRMVVFSVPALDGWRASIDGEPVALDATADALCLVKVPAGRHEVALEYETPGLRVGRMLSALGLLIAVGWMLLRRARRKR